MLIKNRHDLRKALQNKYAFPGGYPTFFVVSDGFCYCNNKRHRRELLWEIYEERRLVRLEINWESELACDSCMTKIESAYEPTSEE